MTTENSIGYNLHTYASNAIHRAIIMNSSIIIVTYISVEWIDNGLEWL